MLIFFAPVQAKDAWEVSKEGAKSGEYSFLVYALTWQPTFCLLQNSPGCKKDGDRFYVHGIWPYFSYQQQKNDGKDNSQLFYNYYPEKCIESLGCYDKSHSCSLSIQSLTLLLENKKFRKTVTSSPNDLMIHEWRKHGTCYGSDQYGYFTDFYKLRDKVVQYNKNKFLLAIGKGVYFGDIKSWFPSNVRFRCAINNNKQYLYEILYLIDRDGNAFNDKSKKLLQIGSPCEYKETVIPKMPNI